MHLRGNGCFARSAKEVFPNTRALEGVDPMPTFTAAVAAGIVVAVVVMIAVAMVAGVQDRFVRIFLLKLPGT